MKYTAEQQEKVDRLQHDYRLLMGYEAVLQLDRIFLQAWIYAGLTASPVDSVFSALSDKLNTALKERVNPNKDKFIAAGKVLGEFEARVNAAVANPDNAELFK